MGVKQKKRRRIPWIWVVVAVVALLIVLMGLAQKPPEELADPVTSALAVRVLAIEAREVPDRITLPGRLDPLQDVLLAAEQDGPVTTVAVDRGDGVTQGQVLLEVDSQLWDIALERAQIDLQEADRDLARYKELVETGGVSRQELDRLAARRDLAAAAVREMEVQVRKTQVRSPLDGRVEDRLVELGEYVTKGMPVVRILDRRGVKLVVDVPERDVRALKEGMALPFTVSSLPGLNFTGTVSFIAGRAEPRSNAYRVEAVTGPVDARLVPGMLAKTEFTRAVLSDAIAIPLAAVIPRKGEHVVYLAEDGRAVRRVVRLHSLIGADAVIASGLDVGDQICVEGHRMLQDGQPVKILPEPAGITDEDESGAAQ